MPKKLIRIISTIVLVDMKINERSVHNITHESVMSIIEKLFSPFVTVLPLWQ